MSCIDPHPLRVAVRWSVHFGAMPRRVWWCVVLMWFAGEEWTLRHWLSDLCRGWLSTQVVSKVRHLWFARLSCSVRLCSGIVLQSPWLRAPSSDTANILLCDCLSLHELLSKLSNEKCAKSQNVEKKERLGLDWEYFLYICRPKFGKNVIYFKNNVRYSRDRRSAV